MLRPTALHASCTRPLAIIKIKMLKTLSLFTFNVLIFLVIFWLIIFLNTYINMMFIKETDLPYSINMFIRWLIASIEGMAILLLLYKIIARISNKKFY